MNTRLIASALLITASCFAIADTTPIETAEDRVLATFDDGPSGFRFVWTRDTGWTFAGHTPVSATALKTSLARSTDAEAQPLAAFTDVETGFRFVWTRDTGWTFVGKVDDAPPLQQASTE